MAAAELSSATKTTSVSTTCAMNSGVIGYRHHEDTKPRRRTKRAVSKDFFADLRARRVFVVPSPFSALPPPASPRCRQRAPMLPDVRLVLVPEMLERRLDRRDRGVAERAERLAADVARDARQQIEVAQLPLTLFDPSQDLVQPVGAFAARRAFAARFVTVEVQQVFGEPHH